MEKLKARVFNKIYFPFFNPILGYFLTKEEMDKEIKKSGIRKVGSVILDWAIPMTKYTRQDTLRGVWKRGDTYWGVSQKFQDYKKKLFGLEQHIKEDSEALESLSQSETFDALL